MLKMSSVPKQKYVFIVTITIIYQKIFFLVNCLNMLKKKSKKEKKGDLLIKWYFMLYEPNCLLLTNIMGQGGSWDIHIRVRITIYKWVRHYIFTQKS
jgi:hypothetical protein